MRKTQALLLALSLVVITTSCSKNETSTAGGNSTSSGGAPAKKLKLAFVANNAANFWTIARTGCNDAAKELGDVDVDFRIPSSGSAAEQQGILNDLVAAGDDGIAVSPIDPDNQIEFLNKIAAQTLLICCD